MTPEHAPSPEHGQGMSRLGGKAVTEAMLRADIDAGAPANADGSINLVHYAAWLVKEMSAGGD